MLVTVRLIGAQNIGAFVLSVSTGVILVMGTLIACAPQAPAGPPSAPTSPPATASTADSIVEDCTRIPELVGREITLVGVQTRAKIPTVCGVDVDGSYAFSDQKVIVRGVLKKTVVNEVEPGTANRGTGTFYSIIDGHTGALAKTSLR